VFFADAPCCDLSEQRRLGALTTSVQAFAYVNGDSMPKFLIEASYTAEGAKGIAKDGGSKRKAFVGDLIKKAGGTMDSFYFAFGKADVYAIFEMPDVASAMALSIAVNASGAVSLRTVPLITPEEVDAASKMQVGYKPPGQV
jgi:uncharacterized protein with GYD domain